MVFADWYQLFHYHCSFYQVFILTEYCLLYLGKSSCLDNWRVLVLQSGIVVGGCHGW